MVCHICAGEERLVGATGEKGRNEQLLIVAPPLPFSGIGMRQEDVMEMDEHSRLKSREHIVDEAINIASRHCDMAGVNEEHIVASEFGKLDEIDLIDGRGVVFYRKAVELCPR